MAFPLSFKMATRGRFDQPPDGDVAATARHWPAIGLPTLRRQKGAGSPFLRGGIDENDWRRQMGTGPLIRLRRLSRAAVAMVPLLVSQPPWR
jgi:hypothetical protein